MPETTLKLTAPEAGLLLNALISLSDDDPSDAEALVLRKYYKKTTAREARRKMEEAGLSFPGDLMRIEPEILRVLKEAPPAFQERTLAVGLLLAEADGTVDQGEFTLLSRYCAVLGTTLGETELFARINLKEVDEVTDETDIPEAGKPVPPRLLDLTPGEAGVGITSLVAFADDDPSPEEVAVVKEYFGKAAVETFLSKMAGRDLRFPEDLNLCEDAFVAGMEKASREEQTRILAAAYKTARADGTVLPEERAVIRRFSDALLIGEGELKYYL